jgi:predicted Rossmann fold nucleotide-binding protein DprA/Smf involved in DNA uptake
MRILVVGNRVGFVYDEVKPVLDGFVKKGDTLISGGADGVDTFAQRYAKERGLTITIHYPSLNVSSPERYFQRNKIMVDDANLIIAFNRKLKSGTTMTINYAKKKGKEVKIYA